jgi:hypothetical protein
MSSFRKMIRKELKKEAKMLLQPHLWNKKNLTLKKQLNSPKLR